MQIAGEVQKSKDSPLLLVEMQHSFENCVVVSHKPKHHLTMQPAIVLLGMYTPDLKTSTWQCMHIHKWEHEI